MDTRHSTPEEKRYAEAAAPAHHLALMVRLPKLLFCFHLALDSFAHSMLHHLVQLSSNGISKAALVTLLFLVCE